MLTWLKEQWAARGPLAVAFDGDGTLWTGDVAQRCWGRLLRERLLRPAAREALAADAAAAGLRSDGDANDLGQRIHDAHARHAFDEQRMCEVHAYAWAGWHRDEMDAFVDETLFDSADLPSLRDCLIGETVAIVRRAQATSAKVFLVSASPRRVVLRAARLLQLDDECVHGSRVPCDADGVLLPEVQRPICYNQGKVLALQGALGGAPLLAAFGDNLFDLPMLRFAERGVMVRPKPRLRAHPDAASLVLLPEQPLA